MDAGCSMSAFDGLVIAFNELEVASGVTASGSVALGNGQLSLAVRVRDGAIKDMSLSLELESRSSVSLDADYSYSGSEEFLVWGISLPPLVIPLGAFSVDVVATLALTAGVDGTFDAEAKLSAQQGSQMSLFVFASDAGVDADYTAEPLSFGASGPTLDAAVSATGRAYTALEASLLIEDFAGPYVRTEAWVEVSGDESTWDVDSGIDLDGGVELSLFGYELLDLPLSSKTEVGDGTSGGYASDGTAGQDLRMALQVEMDPTGQEGGLETLALSDGGMLVIVDDSYGKLVRLDERGALEWAVSMSTFFSADDAIEAIELPSGNVLLAAMGAFDNLKFVELDADGAIVLSTSSKMTDLNDVSDGDFALVMDTDGTLALGMKWQFATSPYPTAAVVGRFTWDSVSGASFEWLNRYDADLASTNFDFKNLMFCADGDLVFMGSTSQDGGGATAVRLEPDGTPAWTSSFGTANNAADFESEVELDDGTLVFVGQRNPDTYYIDDAGVGLMVALDPDGVYAWHVSLYADLGVETALFGVDDSTGYTAYDSLKALATDGTLLYLGGSSGLGGIRDRSGWLAAFDTNGKPLWMNTLDSDGRDTKVTSVVVSDRGLIATGTAEYSDSNEGAFVLRVPVDGDVIDTSELSTRSTFVTTALLPEDDGTLGALDDGYVMETVDVVVTPLSTTWAAGSYVGAVTDITSTTTVTDLDP